MKTLILFTVALFSINSFVFTQQWVQTAGTPEGGGITDMVVTSNGTVIVACASFNWPVVQGGIRRSTNSGATWINSFQHYTARTLALGQNGYVFAVSWDFPANNSEGLWVSSNHGETWGNHTYLAGSGNNIFSVLVKDNNQTVYIGTRTGVLKSTDGGYGFISVNNGIPANSWIRDLAAGPDNIIAAATTKGLFVSSNSAASWVQATGIPAGDTVTTVDFVDFDTPGDGIDIRLNAGSNNGNIYESLEGSQYLQLMILHYFSNVSVINLFQIRSLNSYLRFAIARQPHVDNSIGAGVYSSVNGTDWVLTNEGLPSNPLVSVMAGTHPGGNNYNSYLGLFENSNNGAKIYSRSFPIGIQQISAEVPEAFLLSQNYPNPFNPMTKIKFNVTKTANVNITVFDVLGKHITTLVNEKLNAGSYETEWNANNMPGGVYFYKLETEDFSETKKMILIK